MKILVFGAGVIGSLYAAKLKQAGHDVTLLARGPRLANIRTHGLILEDVVTQQRSTTPIHATDHLNAAYDLALITIRRDQLEAALPQLLESPIPTFLFLLNNPLAANPFAGRAPLGFPGAGGTLEGPIVRYTLIPQQPTTIAAHPRAKSIAKTLREAGFKTQISRDMTGWLQCHAFFITAIAGALYRSGADTQRLSNNPATLRLMCDGIGEGFQTVRTLGRSIQPFALKILITRMPRSFAVRYWRNYFSKPMADYVLARHARASPNEMRAIAADCRQMLAQSQINSPALSELYQEIDAYRK
jgi:2-dehydropantoate 2-reductase